MPQRPFRNGFRGLWLGLPGQEARTLDTYGQCRSGVPNCGQRWRPLLGPPTGFPPPPSGSWSPQPPAAERKRGRRRLDPQRLPRSPSPGRASPKHRGFSPIRPMGLGPQGIRRCDRAARKRDSCPVAALPSPGPRRSAGDAGFNVHGSASTLAGLARRPPRSSAASAQRAAPRAGSRASSSSFQAAWLRPVNRLPLRLRASLRAGA